MKLHKLTIEVEPFLYADYETTKSLLRVTVRSQSKEIVSQQVLDNSDFESLFDFTFDRAKDVLRRELKKLKDEDKNASIEATK